MCLQMLSQNHLLVEEQTLREGNIPNPAEKKNYTNVL